MTDGPLLMQPRPWFSVDSGCCYQQEQKMAFGTCHFVCLVYGYNAAAGACLLSRVRRAPPTWPYPAPWWSCMLFLYVRRFWNASSWCVMCSFSFPTRRGTFGSCLYERRWCFVSVGSSGAMMIEPKSPFGYYVPGPASKTTETRTWSPATSCSGPSLFTCGVVQTMKQVQSSSLFLFLYTNKCRVFRLCVILYFFYW